MLSRLLLALPLPFCSGVLLAQRGHTEEDAEVARANDVTKGYLWPSGRGHVGSYTAASSSAPFDLKASLNWTWHDPRGRYMNSPVSVNLDDKQNIYLTSLDGIRKFTPGGELLWTYSPKRERGEEMPDAASLYDGAVYCSTTRGRVFALSMETGKELWKTKLTSCDGNNGWVSVWDGVVITGSDAQSKRGEKRGSSDHLVTGLDAKSGAVLWNYAPRAPVWNFVASFAGDGTFVFQDYEGRAYRNRVSDGANIWKSGGMPKTWTDGSCLLGPNGVVYTVNTWSLEGAGPDLHGNVSAFRLSDGELMWSRVVPRPPNNMPAIGKLAGRGGLSLVQPIGQQVMKGAPTDIYALDAQTGEVQWIFHGPTQKHKLQKGDDNIVAMGQRASQNVRGTTLPNPWSAPTIDSSGTVFIGSEEGPIFSLRDENGDGVLEGGNEVSTYDAEACFAGSSSPAIGHQMMAIASIDALYVFKR